MPLSWNEIKSRAIAFSKDWSAETSERAESQSFWNAFFHVFGIERRRVSSFEERTAEDGSDLGPQLAQLFQACAACAQGACISGGSFHVAFIAASLGP